MAVTSSASYFSPPQLQSSATSGGGGGGFSLFGWHPSVPNLGGITAIKQLVSGFVGLPEMAYSFLPGGSKSELPQFAKGLVQGVGNVLDTAAIPLQVPFTPLRLGSAIEAGTKAITGTPAEDIVSMSQREGPIAATVNQVSTVAGFAAPIAGILGKAAGGAAEAAALDAQTAESLAGTEGAQAAQEAAQASAARAAQLAGQANLAHQFAHPWSSLLGKVGDVATAARDAVQPAVSEVPASAPLPHEVINQMADALRAQADPAEGAAAAGTRSPLDDAAAAAERAARAETAAQGPSNADLLAQHPGAPTKTLYRGEEAAFEGAARGTNFSENPAYAKNFAGEDGKLYKVDVPVDAEGRPLVGEQAAVENQGHVLPGDWADAARPVEEAASDAKIPKTLGAVRDVNGAVDEAAQQLGDQTAAASEVARESSVAETTAKRITLPPPAWATRLAETLPDSVNRVLANLATPIDRFRLHAVQRDYARLTEVAQRVARQSPAVVASRQAALDLMNAVPELTRFDLTHMVGEEIGARLDGTAMIDSAVKATAGNVHPDLLAALRNVARRGYKGITDEVLQKLSPEQLATLNSHIDDAVVAWRDQARARLDTLLASSHGAQGLEHALLDDTSPTMTPKQVKMYRQAMSDIRRAAKARERIPDQLGALEAAAERSDVMAAKQAAGAATARRLVGIAMRTADDLQSGIPRGIENIEGSIDEIMAGIANQGITYDVGLGREAANMDKGFSVGIAAQFDVPMETFMVQGRDLVREALTNPKDLGGEPYGLGLWAGADARFGAWVHTGEDGRQYVAGDISLASWGGKPMEQWQATILGETFQQEATWDNAAGQEVYMTKEPQVQNLSAHYASDALKSNSELSRFAEQLRKASAGAPGVSADDLDAALRSYMTWDYSLSRSNPEQFKQGDFFKGASAAFAKAEPRNPAFLAQTVLGLSTKDGVEQALAHLDARQVSDALAWYYDSHDYVESLYRGKDVTLLNGETRDAAETFYDLLAVTSVMASPKQNLGRALMAMSNMDDFVSSRRGAMTAAKALMAKLAKVEPGRGEAYANAFEQIPEVRALTHQTSMVTSPKYNVMDILTGKLKLDQATNADVARLPEDWTGTIKSLGPANLPRANVVDHLDRMGLQGPGAVAYRNWAQEHDGLTSLRGSIADLREANPGVPIRDIAGQVLDGTGHANIASLERAYKASRTAETALRADPEVARAFEQALTEWHGSNALAKLRSFRDNLSDPHNSLAVTLDSVMARMYGISGQDWAGGGTYGKYANEIRDQADALSQRFGREVKPHEVQALLWVHTKLDVGRQDWGRLLAHHDFAQNELDAVEQQMASGAPVDIHAIDPLRDYWNEELGYSRQRVDDMEQRDYLRRASKIGRGLTPEQKAQLAELEQGHGMRESTVEVSPDRADLTARPAESGTFEVRRERPYDVKKLAAKEQQYHGYVAVRNDIQAAIEHGDMPEARRLLTSYVVGQRRSIMSDAGGSFQQVGEETRASAGDSAAIAEERLKAAKRVPAPRQWKSNFISPLAARYNREFGLPAPEPIDTLAQVVPERTREVAQATRDMLTRQADGTMTAEEHAATEASYRALQQEIDRQYRYMTKTLGVNVEYVDPDHEYGIGTLGDAPQPQDVAAAHAALVDDVRHGNLKVRGTALAGDGPNQYMGEFSPEDGVMYNDKLRAVHDFFGHAQAANDFSRHGENIAMQLHLQMLPEEAKAAWYTEFRAQTALAVDGGEGFLDAQPLGMLPEAMRQPDYMLRGNLDELHQRFLDHIRGATMAHPGADGRLQMRLFHDAAIDTLAHEGGHLLRQMLPSEDQAFMERQYPHITDEALTPARRASEEKFVSDMMLHIRSVVRGGADQGALADTFRRIAATFEEQHEAWLDSVGSRSVPPDIRSFWTRMFNPEIERPSLLEDPLSTQRVSPGGVETKQFRWESDAQFAQRARQYGEARQAVETARVRAAAAAQRAAKADSAARRMWAAVNEPTRAQVVADKLAGRGTATLDRLAAQMEDPSTAHVAAQWQPMWDAFKGLHAEAKMNGQVAEAIGEIPETFSEVLRYAAERGFDPTHVSDLSWESANRLLFRHIQLGVSEETSALRKERTGALSRAGLADRSLEALSAGMVDATHELYTNKMVNWIEKYYAQPMTPGAEIPKGWVPWEPQRQYIMTGTLPTGETIAASATRMVPEAVASALKDMSGRYDHWAFHVVTRATSPWRTLLLSLSPAWYLKHLVGSVTLSLAEGVRWGDFRTAFNQWREGTLPEDVRSIHSFAQSTEAEGATSLIPRGPKSALAAEGRAAARHAVQQQLFRVNNAMNEIARGGVYEKMLRTGASREAALTRAYTALVDYGDLSPFERNAVRAVIPFYGFQKGILKLLLHFPADHPLATAMLLGVGQIHEETLQDHLGGSIPDAYLGLSNVFGYHNLNLINPFKDAQQLVTPAGIASSFNPFLDVMVRDAYNKPSPGASQEGLSATGAKQEQVNLGAEFASQLAGLPQARLAGDVATGGDVFGQDPGVLGGVASFLGAPKTYSPADLAAIADKVRKATGQPAASVP